MKKSVKLSNNKSLDKIIVRGARTHNLKNISVEMPRNKMIVFTGLSGSGKSSLAFDTIFAEGQRRYVESLSAYARQFLNQMAKPDVDEIEGLSPAISIDQKSAGRNPRSTVATITEIYDYLRVLYARIGKPYCPDCASNNKSTKIQKLTNEEIFNFIISKIKKINTSKKRVLGVEYSQDYITILSPIVRGRKGEYYQMLYDLLAKGYSEIILDGEVKSLREKIILDKNVKHNISIIIDKISIDSFNNKKLEKDNSIRLSESIERAIHESNGLVEMDMLGENYILSNKFACSVCGFSFPEIEPRLFSFNSPYGACESCNGLGTKYIGGVDVCEDCNGKRLRREALSVYLDDDNKINIVDITDLSIEAAKNYFIKLKLSEKEIEIASTVISEIESRLDFMLNVGLDYLQLNRKADTLSGGEAQRIRLASQLGSKLVGALYVLDEPTIGLHQKDNANLIKTLLELKDLGNTIIIVEHDEDTIFASDYIVDIGPGAGVHGGNVIVADELSKLLTASKNSSKSLTLSYLRGETVIDYNKKRRPANGELKVTDGNVFNIKDMNLTIPLGTFNLITGVSGSGKSTLLYEILYKNLLARYDRKSRSAVFHNCKKFEISGAISRLISIDQSAIGRTSRSNPATYTGAWGHIRDIFAETSEARLRGWTSSRFSFNVKDGGRCEACEGNGEIAVEMHFLPTVYVKCDVCNGKRFMKETLEVKWNGKNIYDVLRMTVEEGLIFFRDIPAIYDRLKSLDDVGLSYLELGQSATTLSGGEAQRVKISSELYRTHIEKTIYLMDEPSIGLHYADIDKLLQIINKLVDKGNTVIMIEHNLDIIKNADYVIDIGPLGGVHGGNVVATGTPEQVAQNKNSHTGQYLKKVLKK